MVSWTGLQHQQFYLFNNKYRYVYQGRKQILKQGQMEKHIVIMSQP